jgi:hypothetical protein
MPSTYQKDSFQAIVGLFLEAQGYPLPQHTKLKSPSSLSRFLNRYSWSTLGMIRTTRKAILQQIFQHRLRKGTTLRLIIDLTTLEKCAKFLHLSTPTEASELSGDLRDADPWATFLDQGQIVQRDRTRQSAPTSSTIHTTHVWIAIAYGHTLGRDGCNPAQIFSGQNNRCCRDIFF